MSPMQARLLEQRVERQDALRKHKATTMMMTTHVEEMVSNTPSEPTRLPPTQVLTPQNLEADEELEGMASAVLDPKDAALVREETDAVCNGFAALRAQRAARKKNIQDLKQTTMRVSAATERAGTSRFFRKAVIEDAQRRREEDDAAGDDED